MKARPYVIRYERDDDGRWLASAAGVPGCRTQGRTIEQARERIREALALFVDDAKAATLIDEVRLPATARRALDGARKARASAEAEAAEAAKRTAAAVRTLTRDAGLSMRDASELLGISHQRVAQILGGT